MMKIDFSYIINLSYEYDYVCEKFSHIMQAHGQMPYYVFAGVNGRKLYYQEETTPFGWTIYQNWLMHDKLLSNVRWKRYITVGELGCGISHYWLWSDANKEQRGNTLHLEEDFLMIDWPTEEEWESIPADWDMILLGRNKVNGYEDIQINPHVVLPHYSTGIHAYLLSPSGQEKLANSNYLDNIVPVDEFIWAFAGKSPREDLNSLFHKGDFNIYTFSRREFVTQQSRKFTSQVEFCSDVRDVREWNVWIEKYLNQDFINHNYEAITSKLNTQGGVLEFNLFTKEFCDSFIELLEFKISTMAQKKDSQSTVPLTNIGMERIYNRVVRDYVIPFLNHYWGTRIRNGIFANKNFAFRYSFGKKELNIILEEEHGSTYTLGLRLTENEISNNGLEVYPTSRGNVIIHPTFLTENYEGKKFVYDSQYCILSFF